MSTILMIMLGICPVAYADLNQFNQQMGYAVQNSQQFNNTMQNYRMSVEQQAATEAMMQRALEQQEQARVDRDGVILRKIDVLKDALKKAKTDTERDKLEVLINREYGRLIRGR
jgi:hypothetical protein